VTTPTTTPAGRLRPSFLVLSLMACLALLPVFGSFAIGSAEDWPQEGALGEQTGLGAQPAQSPALPPTSILRHVDLDALPVSLEADRLLLAEIRKEVPRNREEAEVYLRRLEELAARSDPVRLVPLVKRVVDNAPVYYDWLAKEFKDQQEQIAEYYVGGASGFYFALEGFKSAVLFTVINRLDITARVLRELRTQEQREE
jgi:hypothetical protein